MITDKERSPSILVKIDKVLELRDGIQMVAYAHIHKSDENGVVKEFALLAQSPQHGELYLGEINNSRQFKPYDDRRSFYSRSGNRVVHEITAPTDQVSRSRELDEILLTTGLNYTNISFPE
jgi:hypothetical protein